MALRHADPLDGLTTQQVAIAAALRSNRLLTADQIHRLLLPHITPARPGMGAPRYVTKVLRAMRGTLVGCTCDHGGPWHDDESCGHRDRRQRPDCDCRGHWTGLAVSVPSRLPQGNTPAWLLTRAGWEATAGMGDDRRYRQTAAKARGPSQLHTLGIGDVLAAFVEAARGRGDRCGPLDCEREIPHEVGVSVTSIGRTIRRPEIITSDALLRYEVWRDGALVETYRWLIELDRSSLSLTRTRAKIEGYHRLIRHPGPVNPMERWGGVFPPILWIVEGREHHAARTQMRSIVNAATSEAESPYIHGLLGVEGDALRPPILFATKDDLMARGPFARIWRLLADPIQPRSLISGR